MALIGTVSSVGTLGLVRFTQALISTHSFRQATKATFVPQRPPWRSPPGRSPDADLPYEFRLPPGPFDVLEDDGPGACADDEHFVGSPAFDDSDVLTESDFDLFDAEYTSQDAL